MTLTSRPEDCQDQRARVREEGSVIGPDRGSPSPRCKVVIAHDGLYLEVTARRHLARRDPLIHDPLQIALQPPPKVIKHGAAARQDNVRVQPAADVDRRVLDHLVDDLRERGQEVGRVDLGVEEDFGGEESLVADVDRVLLRARGEVVIEQLRGRRRDKTSSLVSNLFISHFVP